LRLKCYAIEVLFIGNTSNGNAASFGDCNSTDDLNTFGMRCKPIKKLFMILESA